MSNFTSKEKLLIVMLEYFKKNKLFASLVLVVYLFVNSLFVLKYANKQHFIPEYACLILYVFFVFVGIYSIHVFQRVLDKIKNFDYYFIVISFLLFFLFLFLNFQIDGNDLNVDRWSAMEVTIESILNGQYPYAVKDHLDQTSSNLPGLFYIALPFYLLGDVGFLQPFCFLLICGYLLKIKCKPFYKVFILFLMLASPAYLWEVVVKSDLMTNLILVILFIKYWNYKYKLNLYYNSRLLAFFCAFFILTRGIVAIPLILFLFRDFTKLNLKAQMIFVFSFLLSILFICLPVLITIPDINTLISFNPINHQVKYAPKLLQILVIVLTFFIAFKTRSLTKVFKYTFIIFTLLLFTTFILNSIEEGFSENLFGNLFDISYLSMILPFAVIWIYESLKINAMHA